MKSVVVRILYVGAAVGLLGATGTVQAETPVGGVILADTTWDLAGSPYVVTSAAGGSVVVGAGATLTIEPGVEVRFESGQALLIGWSAWGAGTLIARGTAESRILFTSNEPTPAPGDWGRLDFLDLAADATFDPNGVYESGCILEHAVVEYAGAGDAAAVNVDQSALYLSHCEVRHNLKRGIAVDSAPPMRVENCHVHGNAGGGLSFASTPGNTLTGNTISANDAVEGGGVFFSSSAGNIVTGNTISENNVSQSGGGMSFGYGSGNNTLAENLISANEAGEGGGTYFNSCDSNTLTGNTISDNSANAFPGGRGGGICIMDCDHNTLAGNTISGNSTFSEIDNFGGGGIYLWNSASNTLSANTIEDNTAVSLGGAIHVSNCDDIDVRGNTIRSNHTSNGETGGIYVSFGSQWLSLNGGPDSPNIICHNDGYEVYNANTFFGGDGRHDIDARNVFWGTDDSGAIQAEIYDFFDDAGLATVTWFPHIWPPIPGDLDADGDVDFDDLNLLLASYNIDDGGDLDGDGDTDFDDLNILLANYGS